LRLDDLVEGNAIAVANPGRGTETDITGLTCDSRQVEPGFLFAALPGTVVDGRDFIADALGRGAACVLAPPGAEIPGGEPSVPFIFDDNPRRQFALIAARFFSRQPECVAAVTGTNGKTSVVTFLAQIWTRLGRQAASMGTLGVTAPGRTRPGALTTPDPVALHKDLAELSQAGVDHLALEASSHGLDQCRLDGVRIKAAAFTNLTRDHLDYHGDAAAYLAAKARLFGDVMAPGGHAVLNAHAPELDALRGLSADRNHQVLTYGLDAGDIHCRARTPTPRGFDLDLEVTGNRVSVCLPLIGDFQIANALCALGLAVACGEDPVTAAGTLALLEGAPGRLQEIPGHGAGAGIYVDYAHSPDALETVLGALRPHTQGRLSVLFGCGGDRDPGKRAKMGRVAAGLADAVIVTDDNPRSEDPALIRQQILGGCGAAREIGDRGEAIRAAVRGLDAGDILVVAGKGHETGQIIGAETIAFSDVDHVQAAIAETRS